VTIILCVRIVRFLIWRARHKGAPGISRFQDFKISRFQDFKIGKKQSAEGVWRWVNSNRNSTLGRNFVFPFFTIPKPLRTPPKKAVSVALPHHSLRIGRPTTRRSVVCATSGVVGPILHDNYKCCVRNFPSKNPTVARAQRRQQEREHLIRKNATFNRAFCHLQIYRYAQRYLYPSSMMLSNV
jgi:hypothetical protein